MEPKEIVDCDVLIIGAGMAGLSAANHLIKNGTNNIKLLEARRRIGGRIVRIPIGNEPVELGANWIHGVLGNPIYELAMQHGLIDILQTPRPHRVVAATESGKQLPFAVLHEIYVAYLCFLRRCEEYYVTQYEPPDGIHSVGDHIRLEIDLYLERIEDTEEKRFKRMIFDCLLKRETCIAGCDDMREIDLLELGSYEELQGGNVTLPGGYSTILGAITKDIPDDLILLDHAVRTIVWDKCQTADGDSGGDSDDSDRTIVDDDNGESAVKVEVICEDGKRFRANHVICTVPLGVLKRQSTTLFRPELPRDKLDAIHHLLFGTVDKIVLEYDRPFLNPNISEVLLLWDRPPSDSMGKDFSKTWYKKIYSFSKITETLLLGWISGREAEYMETLSNEIVVDTCTDILRKFLNDPFIPKPKNCVCTSWHNQPYTRGSYTAIAVGSSQVDIEALAQPLYSKQNRDKPVLLFAGEHTHSSFYSTVHGAFLSGRTAAQLLLTTPTESQEIVVDCDEETNDLSSWIQGICLE